MRSVTLDTRFYLSCLFLFCTFALISCGRGGLTLPAHYDEANTHMVNALDYKNEFTRWLNDLSEQQRPTNDEWLEALRLAERAITEAKLVSQEFLSLAHPDLPSMWNGYFIPSMEKMHLYYFNGVSDPNFVKSPSMDEGMKQVNTILDAQALNDLWGNWYDTHRNEIRAGIRKLAQ